MPEHPQPAVMTITDFSRWSRMGRTRIYEEIGRGALPIFKIGRRTYVRTVDAQAWLDRYVRTAEQIPALLVSVRV